MKNKQAFLQRCNLPYLQSRTFETFFRKLDFVKNLEMIHAVGGGDSVILFVSL